MSYYSTDYGTAYLMHYGIKGMKWGVRRYKTKRGKITYKGKELESKYTTYRINFLQRNLNNIENRHKKAKAIADEDWDKFRENYIKQHGDPIGVDENGKVYVDRAKMNKMDDALDKRFSKIYKQELDKINFAEMKKDPWFIKAESLANKYGMYEWSDKAKADRDKMLELEKRISDYNKNEP